MCASLPVIKFKTAHSFFLGLLIAAFLSAMPVQAAPPGSTPKAQTAAGEEGEERHLSPDNLRLSSETIEVLVTASRGTEQNPLQIPQTIEHIGQEEFNRFQYADVDEAIRLLPNVNLGPAEGTPSYWQEGFTIRGLGGQRVLVLSDGVRQAGQGIGYGGGNLSLYDLYGVERIEILKGPASVLYGTDAFGGVINLITRSPKRREQWGYNGGARYAYDGARSMNTGGGYLDLGNQYLGAVLGGSLTSAGEPTLPHGEDPLGGSFKAANLWGKADYFFSPKDKLRFIYNTTRNRDISIYDSTLTLPIAVFPPPGASLPVTAPFRMDIPDYRRSMLGTEFTSQELSETVELFKTGLYWQGLRRQFHRQTAFYPQFTPGFAGPPLFFDPSATIATADSRTDDRMNTYEWQTQARFAAGTHKLTAGWDIGRDTTKLPEIETQQVIAVAGLGELWLPPSGREFVRVRADQTRFGFYAQDSWDLSPFELLPGLRFDHFVVEDTQSDFSDQTSGFSGSLGALYRRTKEHSLYLNLASGFRAPDLGERFQDAIVNLGAPSRVIGNPSLDPERAYTAEIGSKLAAQRLSLDLSAFVTRLQDYIGTTPLGIVDGFATNQFENIGALNLYGIEAMLNFHPFQNIQLYFYPGRTWTNASEKIDVAQWAFNYGIVHTQPVHNRFIRSVSNTLALRTVSGWDDNTTQSFGRAFFEEPQDKGFTSVNWHLNLDLGANTWGRWSLSAGVKNIFNERYFEPFFYLPQPRRSVFVAAQCDF